MKQLIHLLILVLSIHASSINSPIFSDGPPKPNHKKDGEICHRNMNCMSKCCLPDLYANGTVKHYDEHGFPDRIC